ncbi:MAG: helix-turn-helix domain-containing protein [Eggerthellaceae bacterium]|nr:helix-turn-helix domain-containing protein [Eggerthellaceae bacterium]
MSEFIYGHTGEYDLRDKSRYSHLRVKPETPADEERLAALERMPKGEDIWLDARSVMLYLQMGRTKVYEMIRTGEIPAVRIGRSVRVNKRVLDALLDQWAVSL